MWRTEILWDKQFFVHSPLVHPYSEGNCVFKQSGTRGKREKKKINLLYLCSSAQCFSNNILSVYNLFKAEARPKRAAQSSASGPHLLFLQILNNRLTVSNLQRPVLLLSTCFVMFFSFLCQYFAKSLAFIYSAISFLPPPSGYPDPPTSLRQVDFTHDSVTLEWIPGFNGGLHQRFRIRFSTKRGSWFENVASSQTHLLNLLVDRYRWDRSPGFLYADVLPLGAASFTVTGLQPATTYNFSVNALNTVGESAYADDNAVLTITTAGQSRVTTVMLTMFHLTSESVCSELLTSKWSSLFFKPLQKSQKSKNPQQMMTQWNRVSL